MCRHLLAIVGLGLLWSTLLAAAKEETYPSGKIKAKYAVDDQDQKHGAYFEYYENGTIKVRTSYSAGQLDGPYASFHDDGKPSITASYKQGKLEGEYKESTPTGQLALKATYRDGNLAGWRTTYEKGKAVAGQFYKDGECLLPRSADEIKKALADILKPSPSTKNADPLTLDQQAALRQLKAYRYLCGVPYENLELDPELNKYAQAAAQICDKIGRLDHKPPNPGMPKEEYDIAYKGTTSSNMSNRASLLASIDGYMADTSTKDNQERVGHRRWCLNPAMLKTGFGKGTKHLAMWAHDRSNKEVPDYDYVSFPPRGLVPATYFKGDYSWSISLNPNKCKVPDDAVKVNLYSADNTYTKTGKPLELSFFKVDHNFRGTPHAIIFRPKDQNLAGRRYWVEVEGVKTAVDKPAVVKFLTEFVP